MTMTTEVTERVDAYVAALNYGHNKAEGEHGSFRLSAKPGKKYTRIVALSAHWQTGTITEGSVHAFLENATGLIFKPAGWAGPVKYGAAYDLTDDQSFEALLRDAQQRNAFAGGYLYSGGQSYILPR